MAKKYIVRLNTYERNELKEIVNFGAVSAHKRLHAQILLKADISDDGPGWVDKKISEAFDVTIKTVERVRQRLVENFFPAALKSIQPKKVKALRKGLRSEAHLIALTFDNLRKVMSKDLAFVANRWLN